MHLIRAATLALAVAAIAAGPALATAAGPDQPAVTPVAEPGSALAARAGLSQGQLRDQIAAALAEDSSSAGAWVFDTDAGSDAVLFSDNGSRRRIPASNQKLFTTAAFLAELGAEGTARDARLRPRTADRAATLGPRRRPGDRRRR